MASPPTDNGDISSSAKPAGTYVAQASCGTEGVDPPTAWVSDYPGLPDVLANLSWTSDAVQQASPIVTIEE